MARIRITASILTLLVALHVSSEADTAGVAIGEPAPNVQFSFLDGGKARLGQWLGRQPVYLKIWATWCSTCRKEMPHFRDAYREYASEIAFFSVNAGFNDTEQDVVAFNGKYGLDMPSVIDRSGDLGQAFDLTATPYHILIDGDGTLVHLGHAADATVDRLLARMARQQRKSDRQHPPAATAGNRPSSAIPVPRVGDPAPAFSIETASGSTFSLEENAVEDKPVYLLFFTTWCEWYLADEGDDEVTANACRETRQTISDAVSRSADPPIVIGIASRMWTDREEVIRYRNTARPPYPIALDRTNEVFRRYGIRSFPTLVVISDGRIRGRYQGALDSLP